MEKVENLQAKSINDFTFEDTLYIPLTTDEQKPFFFCNFLRYEKGFVIGKAISCSTNGKTWEPTIANGYEVKAKLTECCLYGRLHEDQHNSYFRFNSLGYALNPSDEHENENNKHIAKHESYGMIGASRVSSNRGTTLFGSSIQHSQTIVFTLEKGEHTRNYGGSDYYHGNETLVEFEMSQTQFAELITSMNRGEGVPCTLKYVNGKKIQNSPYQSKMDIITESFKSKLKNLGSQLKATVRDAVEILENKPSITKGDRQLLLSSITSLVQKIEDNIPFVGTQFQEQMEQTMLEAKHEVEAFVENKLRSAGIDMVSNPNILNEINEISTKKLR